jgi:hypothetical protein
MDIKISMICFTTQKLNKMKTILLILITTGYLLTYNADAQIPGDTTTDSRKEQFNYDQLRLKIHKEKTNSLIFGLAGGVICVTGLVLAVSSLGEFADPSAHHNHYGSAPGILSIGGLVIMSAAIPISIMAKKNEKQMRLYLLKENVKTIPGIKNTSLLSAGIRINL